MRILTLDKQHGFLVWRLWDIFLLQIRVSGRVPMGKKWDWCVIINPRAVVCKVDHVRVSRWDHFKTLWNTEPGWCSSVDFEPRVAGSILS